MERIDSNDGKDLAIESKADSELVRMAQDGSMQAFEELVNRHRNKIYARAFSMMRNEDGAIEMSQLAWIRAWRKLSQFKGDSAFPTWVTRITINTCLDEIRKRKRHQAESIDEMDESGGVERKLPTWEPNPTGRLERLELRASLDQALGQLSESHRSVIILHEFEGMGYKEIADAMNCSIGTVMSRLFYARRKLATLLTALKKELN